MDSRHRPGPAPPPSSPPPSSPPAPRSASPAGFCLCAAGVLPVSVTATARGARGRGAGPGLLASPFQSAARAREASCRERAWVAKTSGLGLDRARATGGGAVPGGAAREESRRATRWLGLDCCTFFFVRCIFRNKKKSPTLHTTSSASLRTRSPATAAWWYGDDCLHRTPDPGSSEEHYEMEIMMLIQ
ncbi:vasodilator-stimulated phosphoprotein-like [Equus quagga]|uniref:vasodilator-stimulated phosphoprotein-like n=1 Tax=Equus quagga TaxID=89248 RepID=UPI001EE212AE|nr:vasodilator-stimulated phosphoprotein-like [Equus quagga]